MPFERFSKEKSDSLFKRYKGDDLFCAWVHTLQTIEQQRGELNAIEIWSETEVLRSQLAAEGEQADVYAEFIFSALRDRHSEWVGPTKGKVVQRSQHEAEQTAILIMIVLFSQMADGAEDESDEAIENNPNKAVCRALGRIIMNPKYREDSERILKAFTHRKINNRGEKIILHVTDYMAVKTPMELMDDEAKQTIEEAVSEIVELTSGLNAICNINWNIYIDTWRSICACFGVMELLNKISPRDNKWGKNLKFVANVLGIMKDTKTKDGKTILLDNVSKINELIEVSNVRSYISNYKSFGTTDSELTKDLYDAISQILTEKVE